MARKLKMVHNKPNRKTAVFAGHVLVVGGYYHDMWEAKMDGNLKEGDFMSVQREATNHHDHNAIAVYTADRKTMIGYMAKEDAQRYAPFLDAGVKLALRVFSLQEVPLRVKARLYVQPITPGQYETYMKGKK